MRIIIKCPESDSPLRGRIHLRGLSFRRNSNLLQFGGGPYMFQQLCSDAMAAEPRSQRHASYQNR